MSSSYSSESESEQKIKSKKIRKEIIKDPKNKNNKGRKKKPKEEQSIDQSNYFFNNGYISQDQTCQDLIEFLTKQGQVRIIQKTNQNIFVETTMINKQLQSHPKFYFLSLKDNSNYTISENGKVQDMNEYHYLDETNYKDKFQSLIQKINLCIPLLEPDFINDLQKIINKYTEYYQQSKDPEYFANSLAQDIRESQEYQYIKQWSSAKSLSRDIQLEISLSQLEQEKEKNNVKKSQKPKEKTESLIQTKQQDIEQEKKFQPLEYFIYKLVLIFEPEVDGDQEEELAYQFFE